MRDSILLVTRNFPPLRGGMERLNFHVYRQLSKEFDMALCGPRGAEKHVAPTRRVEVCPAAPVGRFLVSCQAKAARLAIRTRPRLVMAGSGLTSVAARMAGALAQAPVVTYVHGLDLVVDHDLYRLAFLRAIRGSALVLANSRNTHRLAVEKGVDPGRLLVLNPGVEINDPLPEFEARDFVSRHALEGRKIILSVGRLTPRKGLLEFVEHCLTTIVRIVPEAVLVVVGGEAANAVRGPRASLASRITDRAKYLGLDRHLMLLGEIGDRDLSRAYAAASLLIFPALDLPGDVEGFGMVAVEAAAAGIPTVAFAVGGVADAVQPGESGTLIQPRDYPAMSDAVVAYLKGRARPSPEQCRRVALTFSWERFGARLRDAVSGVIEPRR